MIVVLFTCHKCGIQRVKVGVRERTATEDIVEWMRMVGQKCGDRHSSLMPHCPERKLDLGIPTPKGEDGIGMSATPWPENLDTLKELDSRAAN